MFIALSLLACDEDVQNYDFERYKFVSFIDESASFFETYSAEAVLNGEEEGFPIYLQYDGSVLDEDFTVELNIVENFASAGVDYTINSTTVQFKAGEVRSEPFYIYTIDDLVNSPEDRSLLLEIKSVSRPDIAIGVGVELQMNKSMTVEIIDNECSNTPEIFASQNIDNATEWGNYTVSATVENDIVTFKGNLIAYGSFPNAELAVTLTPAVAGATSGTATFDDYYAGVDNDGWEYQLRQVGTGSFDVCAGTVEVKYDVYYKSGGWVYWYTVSNTYTVQ